MYALLICKVLQNNGTDETDLPPPPSSQKKRKELMSRNQDEERKGKERICSDSTPNPGLNKHEVLQHLRRPKKKKKKKKIPM